MLHVYQHAFHSVHEKQKGVQMQNFNIKEDKEFSLDSLDIT